MLDLNVGNAARADDVSAASISVTAAQTQGNLINAFCQAKSLRLNADKTELVMVTKGVYSEGTHQLAGWEVQVQR